ncbi:hypothetical protein L195_g007626 [Trifolium pratense]|uniref:RNase H type-1 domain-containing protein n=1 Tax=Trifolium pratense TaxID=57577 RepID=A0A2K3P6X2_TRIPR|nr:hypothetical protein L195_g007626 [Trifolium pratense]
MSLWLNVLRFEARVACHNLWYRHNKATHDDDFNLPPNPPKQGWIRLNSDDASKDELWGVLEGLNHAGRLGFSKVELHVDSMTVAHVI